MVISTTSIKERGITQKPITTPHVILVVEQEQSLRGSISSTLRREGYVVLAIADGTMAVEIARDNALSLILIDLLHLEPDGLALCCHLRSLPQTAHIPMVVMLDDTSEIAQIESQGVRGDDYLLKPLVWEELRACILTLLHESKRMSKQKVSRVPHPPERQVSREARRILVVDDLRIDVAQRTVIRGDHHIEFTSSILFDLLVYLVRQRGVTLSREQLLREVWGYENASLETGDTRTLSVHIHWLREMLDDDPVHPHLIHTVRGVGYHFKREEPGACQQL